MGKSCWRASFNCHTDLKLGSSTYFFLALFISGIPRVRFEGGYRRRSHDRVLQRVNIKPALLFLLK